MLVMSDRDFCLFVWVCSPILWICLIHGIWTKSNSLILFFYHQCPTMHAGACVDADEDQSSRSIKNQDREVTAEEPHLKPRTVKVSNTGSYAVSTFQIVTPCNSFHMSSQILLYVLVCNEGYLCLSEGGVLIIGVVFWIFLMAFSSEAKHSPLSCSCWLSSWLEVVSSSWVLCSNTRLCALTEVTACLSEGVVMWVGVQVGFGVGAFARHRTARWAIMVYW
jgi:hypothetical protein